MKVADVEKRVAKFTENLNKEFSVNASAKVITKRWQKYDKDRTYIKVEFVVNGEKRYFDAGFINNETNRYNKEYFYAGKKYSDDTAVDLSKKDDTEAFAIIRKALEKLEVKEEVEESTIEVEGVSYTLPDKTTLADNKVYVDKKGRKFVVLSKKAVNISGIEYDEFRVVKLIQNTCTSSRVCDWTYSYDVALEDAEDYFGDLTIA